MSYYWYLQPTNQSDGINIYFTLFVECDGDHAIGELRYRDHYWVFTRDRETRYTEGGAETHTSSFKEIYEAIEDYVSQYPFDPSQETDDE